MLTQLKHLFTVWCHYTPINKANKLSRKYSTLVGATLLLLLTSPVHAKCVDLYFTKPTRDGEVKVVYDPDTRNKDDEVTTPVKITKDMSASKKRNTILAELKEEYGDDQAKGRVHDQTGNPGIRLCGLKEGENSVVRFEDGNPNKTDNTNEQDLILGKNIDYAAVTLDQLYNSTGIEGRPATLSIGILTDLGQVEFTYRASDTPDDEIISGDVIAELLFEGLKAPASELGVDIELNGNQIVVNFVEDVSKEGAGVSFQSTSISGNISGTIEAGSEDIQELQIEDRTAVFTLNGPFLQDSLPIPPVERPKGLDLDELGRGPTLSPETVDQMLKDFVRGVQQGRGPLGSAPESDSDSEPIPPVERPKGLDLDESRGPTLSSEVIDQIIKDFVKGVQQGHGPLGPAPESDSDSEPGPTLSPEVIDQIIKDFSKGVQQGRGPLGPR